MRIDIVGLPASGKSTFADALSRKLSIPHIHLDQFWFESGGRKGLKDTPHLGEVRAQVRERVEVAITSESWVSDGTYLHVQDVLATRADVIIFLDIPLLVRLWAHLKRTFFQPRRHSHLSLWNELSFYPELIRRNFTSKQKLDSFVDQYADKVMTLRSWREMDMYLESL